MIKVMIADDEQIVREGIEFILNRAFTDVSVVAVAGSGREAVELFEETRPDLVYMDIQMPGINGLDAIEMILERDRRIRFIIVSAYEQFDYAKKAVQLGVEDYILKPINRKRLETITSKVMGEIEAERKARRRELATQEKLDQILPVLEHGYIYSVLMNTDYQEEQIHYHQLLDIHPVYAFMMVIEVGDGDRPGNLTNKIGIGIKGDRVYSSIRETIKYKCKAVVGPMMVNRISVLVYGDGEEDDYARRVHAVELADTIAEKVEKLTGSHVFIGIGSCMGLEAMNLSYHEAVRALGKMTDERILHIKDAVDVSGEAASLAGLKNDEEGIVRKVEEGDVQGVSFLMKGFFGKLRKVYSDHLNLIRQAATELMVLIHAVGYRNGCLTEKGEGIGYIDEIAKCEQVYELISLCLALGEDIADRVHNEKSKHVSGVIEEAMVYMDSHYNEDLRLKDVAEVVAISPQYFSRIFKKELGAGFIDYLTRLRIDKAKEMLKAGKMSIKEICYETGYNDPNYFSRLFKKTVGVSPTDYVKE